MSRRVHTADDVLRLASSGAKEFVVAPGERLTPLARDVAGERGIKVKVVAVEPRPAGVGEPPGPRAPRLLHVPGVNTLELDPFPVEPRRPEMDVRLREFVTAEHDVAMAAGMISLRAGSFPWTLDYDEVEYVIEGELHITTADEKVVGRAGDVIAVPKGSSITFGTPSWARFLYVTYPADWAGAS